MATKKKRLEDEDLLRGLEPWLKSAESGGAMISRGSTGQANVEEDEGLRSKTRAIGVPDAIWDPVRVLSSRDGVPIAEWVRRTLVREIARRLGKP